MRGPRWTTFLLAAACLGAIAAAVVVVGPDEGQAVAQERTVTAARGVVQETVSGSGTLQPANQVDVNFASGGTLERVAVKAGDHVRKGEVLATIDGRDADIELQKAAASLDAAQTNLTEVEDAYDADASSATAAPSNGSTGATTTAADVASAKADLAGAQATYDAAVKGVADTTLKAPITGTVASVSNVAGEIVSGGGSSSSAASNSAAAAGGSDAAAAGQDSSSGAASSSGSSAFIVLVALRRLELVVPFSESDIDQIEVGQAATVSVTAVPDEQLAAHVRSIDTLSTTNSGVVSYNATFRLDQSSGAVRPGMTATAKVVVAQADNAVNVSTAAISRRGPFSSVTVVRDGKRVVQRVETGIAGDSTTQILSGLTSGEQVVMRIAVATGGSALQASGAQSSGTLGGQRALLGGGFGGAGGRPVIEVAGLTKTYDAGRVYVHALRDVSLRIERGEMVAIMGSSGSGKSTLMNILGCLDLPTSGRYLLDGIDVRRFDEDALSDVRNRKIGFVFQSFNLVPRTRALANVELPLAYAGMARGDRRLRAQLALEAVGMRDRTHHLPSELSGGQLQRVAIARAMVTNPPLILADEPTGNLDSRSTREVLDIFDRLNREGRTIVLITHEADVAERARRVIRLADGRVVEDIATSAGAAA